MGSRIKVHHLVVSAGHNFFGRHGQPAENNRSEFVERIRCRAGLGIEGDRFFGFRPDYKGQVTFFSWEVFRQLTTEFGVRDLSPATVRRNVVIEGVDLNELIGARFSIGAVEFFGTEEARPCYWMNGAVAEGAETWLRGRGGLRARVLTDGGISLGEHDLARPETLATLPLFSTPSLVGA